ncbi:MAG: photosystem II S4 domain protein [Cyanobium sp.]|jgi:photosystem II S4 domain protein|nr:photosystem II S4 domain protein [Synechococcaceae cyanobacterium]
MLPRQALLAGNPRAAELDPVLRAAERAVRTWQPIRTGFLDPALREAAAALLEPLSEVAVHADGGYGGAERCQLVLSCRASRQGEESELAAEGGADPDAATLPAPLQGLEIVGNFLFDPASPAEFQALLLQLGAREPELGDLWLRGDRGAQVVVAAGLAERLEGRQALLRSVPVRCERRPLAELRPPRAMVSRDLTTVEASLRLDALASAGFGLSRSRMAGLIRQGAVRLNWQPVSSPSRLLQQGDRVRLEGRGELTILAVTPTQRGRLRVAMRRGGG